MPTQYSTYHVTKEIRLPVPVEMLWDLISNTEHLNRMIGLPAVIYGPIEQCPSGTFRWAQGDLVPLGRMRWQEFPFEWVKPEKYRVRRLFSNGPFVELNGGVDIEPTADGSLIRVMADIIPRTLVGWALVSPVADRVVKDTLDYCQKAVCKENDKVVLVTPMPKKITVDKEYLQVAQERLKKIANVSELEIQRLIYILVTCSDEEVLGMRPFALADRWRIPRRNLLRTFLYATRAGLLELEWQLKCPYCRVSKSSHRTLAEVTKTFHCDFCGIDYTTDMDFATELRFNVNPAIRSPQKQIFCVGSPVNSPHVLCQQVLLPDQSRTERISIPDATDRFRLRVLQKNLICRIDVVNDPSAPNSLTCRFDGEKWNAEGNYVSAGTIELVLHNSYKDAIVAVLEDVTPDPQAVSAALVTLMPEFREEFSSEVLAPGREVSIRQICFLFTDLKGSTALYENIGDAAALGRVYKHFDYLTEIIDGNEGTVVKVMGDAVMAAFSRTEHGLRAALEIQHHIGKFNQKNGFQPPLVIKIGLHKGPVFAVTANGRLDYFGQTVNKTARLEDESHGGDVVCSTDVLNEPGIDAVWTKFPIQAETLTLKLNGISAPVTVYRLTVQEE